MWDSYSRWIGEAQERYESDVGELSRMAGLGGSARQQALDTRFEEYQSELGALRAGPTYTQLRQHFTETGGEGDMDEWLRGQYGGYQPQGVSGRLGERIQGGPPPRPGSSAGGEASMAGLGDTRPWWSKA